MKTAVVFFSYQGTTRHIAHAVAGEIGATPVELEPVVHRRSARERTTFAWGSHQIRMPAPPEITHDDYSFHSADLIVVGTPVWGGSMAPPVRAFLRNHEFFRRSFALFSCYAGRAGNAIPHMRDLLIGNSIIGELALREPRDGTLDAVTDEARRWAQALSRDLFGNERKEASGE